MIDWLTQDLQLPQSLKGHSIPSWALVLRRLLLINWLIQDLELPESLKGLYKTVWEIKQRILVDMAADRGAYIDQSQSFNVHMSDPNFGKLTSLHFYGWKVSTATTRVPCA